MPFAAPLETSLSPAVSGYLHGERTIPAGVSWEGVEITSKQA